MIEDFTGFVIWGEFDLESRNLQYIDMTVFSLGMCYIYIYIYISDSSISITNIIYYLNNTSFQNIYQVQQRVGDCDTYTKITKWRICLTYVALKNIHQPTHDYYYSTQEIKSASSVILRRCNTGSAL
jgi:hypothetical protein